MIEWKILKIRREVENNMDGLLFHPSIRLSTEICRIPCFRRIVLYNIYRNESRGRRKTCM